MFLTTAAKLGAYYKELQAEEIPAEIIEPLMIDAAREEAKRGPGVMVSPRPASE